VTVPTQVRVRLDWSQTASAAAQHANQVLAQVGTPGGDGLPDGIYITLGSAPPPPVLDDDPQRDEFVKQLIEAGVRVNVLGQFHISRQLLSDLISVLQVTAEKYDAALRQATSAKEDDDG
jgi:hypothetical protein